MNGFFDVYYNESKKTFCYRSKDMIYEERFEKGALMPCGWNGAGYPLDVLTNFPSRLDTRRYAEPFSFNLEIDGQCVSYDLEFVSFEKEETDNALLCRLTLKSNIKPLEITVCTLLDGSQMFSRWLEIKSLSDKPMCISKIAPISGGFEDMDTDHLKGTSDKTKLYSLGYFDDDSWGREGQFRWRSLNPDTTAIDGRFLRDRFRHPLIFLKNNVMGHIWFCQLAYSGGYRFTIDYNAKPYKDETHLSFKAEITGHSPILVLKPFEKFTTPEVHIGMVHGDLDCAINEMHTHTRRSVLNNPFTDPSPALIGCGMGAEHNMDISGSKAFIDQFAEMGGEVFIVDAGWVCPPTEETSWGDYNGLNTPDENRYPNGIKEICDYAHEKGLKFGLWMDIENLGRLCPLFEEKPDFRSDNVFGTKNPRLIDMSIPEVSLWAENELSRVIEEYELDLLRVDYNVDYTEYFSMRDTGYGIKECVTLRHNKAVYDMYNRLKEKYPNVIFENCAGGGGRTDLGMMKNFNHTWVSDNQKMPYSVSITNGMTMALPPERVDRLFAGMGCHTIGSFKAHLRNTMLGHVSLNVISPEGARVNDEAMKFIKHSTDIYKNFIRPFLSESVIYHHTPELYDEDVCVLEIGAPDKSKGAITVFTMCNTNEQSIVVKPKGIDRNKNYSVTLNNDNCTFTVSGYELSKGIEVNLGSAMESELILYEAV